MVITAVVFCQIRRRKKAKVQKPDMSVCPTDNVDDTNDTNSTANVCYVQYKSNENVYTDISEMEGVLPEAVYCVLK